MNDKNIEEKAMEFTANVNFSNRTGIYIINEMQGATFMGYKAGYNQAVTDQQETLTQYKEALQELYNASLPYSFDAVKNQEARAKAKQLLKIRMI